MASGESRRLPAVVAMRHSQPERLALQQDADAVNVIEIGAGRQRHAHAAMAAGTKKPSPTNRAKASRKGLMPQL